MNPLHCNRMDPAERILAHRSGVVKSREASGGCTGSAGNVCTPDEKVTFQDALKSRVEQLRFSAHASSRLKSRNISMTPEIMGKLEKAVSGAAQKGARDSLILLRDLAFIVNVPNKTVITAMDGESIKDNVFTNIDSTVIAG